ncbi:uncharacterized protein ARMOST_16203 [Armillaria ostoyae]|uniref:Uncharacterized protein n=1 Tax=Armillaria ostoyae TaxID=47428 RepID=A0A284RVI8_ARMOS|nr:uncharacterized protein ARMOST_16203 [Armillaria ostoyae]
MKTAEQEGSVSTQMVKREHSVTMVEVPDEEDDMAYQQWLARHTKREPATPSPTGEALNPEAKTPDYPKGWMKPFKAHHLDTRKTAAPISVYNTDCTCNKVGNITEFVEFQMTIRSHRECIDLMVTDLGSKDLYLGHDWLKHHNPVINWKTGTILFGCCQCVKNPFPLPNADPSKYGRRTKTFKEMVPPDYRSFWDLFLKENFNTLPKHKSWNHAIELIPNASSTLDCKVYPLNRDEQEQLNKFLDENLDSE